jgi:hypothetical protein
VRFIRHLPLLFFVAAAYNVLVFLPGERLHTGLMSLNLMSGAAWTFTFGDLLLAVAVVFLYVEIYKATRTSSASIADHALSMGVFVLCLIEFIVVPRAGTSVFFIIMLITLLDVIAGFTITISTARRDFGVGTHVGS